MAIAKIEAEEERVKNEEAGQWLLENNPEMKPPERNLVQQAGEVGKELNRAAKGGLKDTVSSVITLPNVLKTCSLGRWNGRVLNTNHPLIHLNRLITAPLLGGVKWHVLSLTTAHLLLV